MHDGMIDIHSHLIPGVDDGCETVEQSLEVIRRLKEAGYAGSICTPHVWYELFPENSMANIRRWVAKLAEAVEREGIEYRLWPGGEVRLTAEATAILQFDEVPTLAGSSYVLTDMWNTAYEPWMDEAFEWLFARGYQPILAHPERLKIEDLDVHVQRWLNRGVLMQGNFLPLTGYEGERSQGWGRRFLSEGAYTYLALDVHTPETLEPRLAGVEQVAAEYGVEVLEAATQQRTWDIVLGGGEEERRARSEERGGRGAGERGVERGA